LQPLRRAVAGALAGVAATLAMDLVWYVRARREGSDEGFAEWEVVGALDSWDAAPAPGQMGCKILRAIAGSEPPVERAAAISNAMHWIYGTSWAIGYALAFDHRRGWAGPALGAAVWSADYVTLPLAGLYEPIWRYDAPTLIRDLGAHLVFGTVTDVALRVAERRASVRTIGSTRVAMRR